MYCPFKDKVYHFPMIQIVDRRIKVQANTSSAGRESILPKTALHSWHCDMHRAVINQSSVTYWPCSQIHDKNLDRQKGQSELMCGFGKTVGIVCRRRHNGVSVQNQHKWNVVRAEESEGEKIEGGGGKSTCSQKQPVKSVGSGYLTCEALLSSALLNFSSYWSSF